MAYQPGDLVAGYQRKTNIGCDPGKIEYIALLVERSPRGPWFICVLADVTDWGAWSDIAHDNEDWMEKL